MKIYLLRHELRPLQDSTLLTELFDIGKERASGSLKELLLKEPINEIYASPFLRVLQTVNPYSEASNIKIKGEFAITEFVNEPMFEKKPNLVLSDDLKSQFNLDKNYQSMWNPSLVRYPEPRQNLIERTKLFARYLENQYKETDKSILIVSHMDPIQVLLSYFTKQEYDRTYLYKMGRVVKIDTCIPEVLCQGYE